MKEGWSGWAGVWNIAGSRTVAALVGDEQEPRRKRASFTASFTVKDAGHWPAVQNWPGLALFVFSSSSSPSPSLQISFKAQTVLSLLVPRRLAHTTGATGATAALELALAATGQRGRCVRA